MSDAIGNYAQIAAAAIAFIALVFAANGWRLSRLTFRTSFRPVVRPVPLFSGTRPVRNAMLLKNYGRGPAFSVMLYEDSAVFRRADPIAMVGVVEPLGAGAEESKRIGRTQMKLFKDAQLIDDKRYRLIYQDLEGRFHETTLTVGTSGTFSVRFLGTDLVEEVPDRAVHIAAIVPPEFVE